MKKVVLLILFYSFLFSCKKKKIELDKISREIMQEEYNEVYSKAFDSVLLWSKLELPAYDEFTRGFILDSIICFNIKKDKAVMALSYQLEAPYKHDGMEFFYGAKIKDTWYFFTGAAIHLPREMYQKDITKPLSFEKLHEIALKEVFSGYLKEKPLEPRYAFWKSREYEVNEDFFKQVESQGIDGTYAGCRTFEEKVMFLVKKNWGIYEPCNYKLITITDKKNNAYFDFVDSLDFVDLQKKGYVDSAGNLLKFYKRHCQNSDYLNEHYPRQH